jgi:hydroxypyruvate isomerase
MPKFAANLSFLFNEQPFMERFEAAAKAGFKAVEYMFPYEFDAHELRSKLDACGLEQVLFNMRVPDWVDGGRGMLILPDRRDEFRQSVRLAADYALVLGVEQVNCLGGIAPSDADASLLRRTAIDNLRFAASELGGKGIRLLIEPINPFDMPGFYLNTADQVADIIEETGSDNLFLQYDIYHQQRMRGEIISTFLRLKDRIAHIQIADTPGRHEPGSGEIDFANVFGALDCAGYAGWVGCEYKPKTTTVEGLGWMTPYLRASEPKVSA